MPSQKPTKTMPIIQTQSLTNIDLNQFPDQIISEILIRLPAKSLHQYKLVSKRWLSIIHNPHFIASYISHADPSWLIFNRVAKFTDPGSDSDSDVVSLDGSDPEPPIEFELTPRPGLSSLTLNPKLISDHPVITDHPAQILQSSNGLVLCVFTIKNERKHKVADFTYFSRVIDDDSLFVSNPVTGEWAPISLPEYLPLDMRFGIGFTSRVDPRTGVVDKFVIVEYQHLIPTNTAVLQCFSSDTGKWVTKPGSYFLPPHNVHPYRPYYAFEFDGQLFWPEFSAGVITWDPKVDIFSEAQNDSEASCRLIPLPAGREKPVTDFEMLDERRFSGVRGKGGRSGLQYVELFRDGGDILLKCWRLKDFRKPVSKWSLMYKISRVHVQRNFGCKKSELKNLKVLFLHPPFEADSVFLQTEEKHLISFNFRTRKVESCFKHSCVEEFVPVIIPRWPVSIPAGLYAAYAKEEGNDSFKNGDIADAISLYSKSLSLSPNAIAYANRAMAYLKINSFHEAEDDCTEALKMDKTYFKGYARRAVARKELGNLEGSKEDVESALKMQPDNQQMKALFAEVISLIEKTSSEGCSLDVVDQ